MSDWQDPRLQQAYDLIDAALQTHNNPNTDIHGMLKTAREAVEEADVEIEKGRA